jgi:hypothetical protein
VSAEQIALWLVIIAAVPQTLFVALYGFASPWWRSQTGRAIFTKAFSMALLLDLSLVNYWWGPINVDASNAVIALVAVGCWLQFVALAAEKLRGRQTAQGYDS